MHMRYDHELITLSIADRTATEASPAAQKGLQAQHGQRSSNFVER